MKIKLLIIAVWLMSLPFSYGQEINTLEKESIIKYSKSNIKAVNRYLFTKQATLRLRLHPYIEHHIVDTLQMISNHAIDSSNIVSRMISDSMQIHLKDSYSWNISKQAPAVSRKDIRKLKYKEEAEYTKDDYRLLNYLDFQSLPDDALVDKFMFFQNYDLNHVYLIQVAYQVKFNEGYDIKQLWVQKIKKTNQ